MCFLAGFVSHLVPGKVSACFHVVGSKKQQNRDHIIKENKKRGSNLLTLINDFKFPSCPFSQ